MSATGTMNVAANPDDPAHYVVSVDLDFGGSTLKIRFDGQTLDAYATEVLVNEVVYDGESLGIKDVVLDALPNAESTYTVMLTTERDDVVNITLPMEYLDGNAHGFSQSQYLYIEYGGKIYSKATGYSGTVTIGIKDGVMKVEATNYNDLEITYEGPYGVRG